MIPVNADDEVPDAGPELEVRRVNAASSVQVVVLGPKLKGFWTHWNAGRNRTQPCVKPVESCPGHKSQLPLRWKAYLHVWDVIQKDQALLEFTPGAARQLQHALSDRKSLRGIRLTISRGKGPKARLTVNIQQLMSDKESARLPKERDPLVTLAKLWGFAPDNPPPESDAD